MLARLAEVAAGEVDLETDPLVPERLLGRRTGELHVALSRVPDAAFRPEPTTAEDIAADVQRVARAAQVAAMLLQEQAMTLPDALRERLPNALTRLRVAAERARGFWDEMGTRRLRVHGDYHLGQVLRTPDEDWTFIDFEGEPARPVADRRRKTSALKDVAGMLRSFGYARGVAARSETVANDPLARSRLDRWERSARQAFLAGYRDALRAVAAPLTPEDDAAFARALAAWELDKALYEIAYEARNRPDWLEIPLRALLPEINDQTAEEAGAAPA
jgi:maltose alpha-D-glucosyltransferase/alpha-amylase